MISSMIGGTAAMGLNEVLAWLMAEGYLKREGVPWYRQGEKAQ